MNTIRKPRIGRSVAAALAVLTLVMVTSLGGGAAVGAAPSVRPRVERTAAASAGPVSYHATKTLTRTHLVDGKDDEVDSRTVSVTVDATDGLKDRQAVNVTWTGAHPTGGLATDRNSGDAAREEYPVVVMQCRGVDSTSAPAARRISPQTCWTQTPDERFQYSETGYSYPSYRMDRYARTEDRAARVNQPDPLPKACPTLSVPHYVPFKAEDGTTYAGGRLGCAGLAPEAANAADSLQPGSTTYGVADEHGDGSAKFVMQGDESNASLGCSQTVKCTLVVIPIMGVSCDPAGTASGDDLGMPEGQRPSTSPTVTAKTSALCMAKGQFSPGDYANADSQVDLAVTGSLWWSASNWRNRFSVPLDFAPSASVCDIVGGDADTVYAYGSEALQQATQQWQPHFCLNSTLFNLRHVQTGEPQAKNLLADGSIQAAIQAVPPTSPLGRPTVQAPTALSGWGIAFDVDGADGQPVQGLRLDARLLAKLLSESYRSCVRCLDFDSTAARRSGFSRLADNPLDITRDPEFEALNPTVGKTLNFLSASTLEFMSSDSDVMRAVTGYIDADPEAREWLNGVPDPWGMVVNPAYKGIGLPLDRWPLLDTNLASIATGTNTCLEDNPVPWLPLVASPVSDPATIALHMQFSIANSQIICSNNGQPTQKLGPIGREPGGQRFTLGLVSYSDAVQYQLDVAQLQTQRTTTGDGQFDDAGGRTFVAPTQASIRAAGRALRPNDSLGTWPVSYDALRTEKSSRQAYPGVLLLSTDIPTTGLGRTLAREYATYLRFVAGDGQRPGRDVGELPYGYVPITSRNGLSAMADYTRAAADAVVAQRGKVPNVSGKPLPADASGAALPPAATGTGTGPGGGGAGGAAGGAGGGAATPPAAGGAGSGATPRTPGAATTSPAPTNIKAAPVGKTTGIGAGALGLVLPALAIMALVAIGFAVRASGMGRRA